MTLQYAVMKSGVSFFTSVIYVQSLVTFLEDSFSILCSTIVAGYHQRGHLALIQISDICSKLAKYLQIGGGFGSCSVVYGLSHQIVANIKIESILNEGF